MSGPLMNEHFSVELTEDVQQWWAGLCNCGADLGMFPTAEDACDALMQHAFDEGKRAANSQADPE